VEDLGQRHRPRRRGVVDRRLNDRRPVDDDVAVRRRTIVDRRRGRSNERDAGAACQDTVSHDNGSLL
jgi:hypothetical protein